jgi:two-component system sensor histidine kinase BarA
VSEVIVADNGMSAIEFCQAERFSLIFMDIQMPIMDGISALKEIKKLANNSTTPIIAVTAHALSGEKEKLYQQGFNAYMTKPIDESMLRHIIYEYCDFSVVSQSKHTDISIQANLSSAAEVFDVALALKRSANDKELAKEMLIGLVDSLPKTSDSLREAIGDNKISDVKRLIHKLNGACCYTGTHNLSKVINQLETQLKNGSTIEILEPEFLEFFEHVEQIIIATPKAIKKIEESDE